MAIRTRRGKLYPPVEREFALALGIDEMEWDRIVDRLGRPPNHFECYIFASLWSERVANKSSESLLDTIRREDSNVHNIDGSQLKMLDIGCGQYLALRVVHNNQQSMIEPSFGAQTALDQSLEELATAGARPLAMLSLLRVGSHDLVKNQRLFQGLVDGISNYGGRVGTPLVGGDTYFHKSYNRGMIVNGGVVGLVSYDTALRKDEVPFKSPVLYVGSPTGKENLPEKILMPDEEAPTSTGQRTLKISDPLLENRMLSACAEAIEQGVLQEIVAVGPGGLAVAAFDLASRVRRPILLDIDRIPIRGSGELKPLEIILSESSQRLLIVTRKEHHRALTNIFYKWDIFNVKVGEVNDSDGIEFYWNHYPAADIPFQFALEGSEQMEIEVVQFPPMLKRRDGSTNQADKIRRRKRVVEDEWSLVREVALSQETDEEKEFECPKNLEDIWLDLLADPNLCSRAAMYQLFDQVVGANTIQKPGGDSALLRIPPPVLEELPDVLKNRGLAISFDSNSLYVSMEPYLGTVQTVAEGMRNLAAVGARPIGLAHCLNFGNPSNYKEICDLAESIRGLGDASSIWEIPMLSENVSLYNGTDGTPILPTPSILIAGMVKDFEKSCSIGFKESGDVVLLLGQSKNEIGCTEYANHVHKRVNRLVPDIDFELERSVCELVVTMIEQELLNSAHDLSIGGLAVALTECCMSRPRPIGARLNVDMQVFDTPNGPVPLRRDAAIFGESCGRFLISCSPENEEIVRQTCAEFDIPITAAGEVGGKMIVIEGIDEISLPVSTTYRLWTHRMEYLLGHSTSEDDL